MTKAVTAHSSFLKLGLLIFSLAVFIPAAANTALASLPPYIKSIEYVEITLNGVTSASTNLNKSQTIANCVPFATSKQASAYGSSYDPNLLDIFFEAGPKVTASRGSATGTIDIGIYVVEFDSTYVRVQQGPLTLTGASSGTTDITYAVDTTKAAFVSYYKISGASDGQDDTALAGDFQDSNTLRWQRGSTTGNISGHFYVFEDLSDAYTWFSVQYVSWTLPAGSSPADGTITGVAMDKTFVIASYLTSYGTGYNRIGQPIVWLNSTTTIRAQAPYCDSGKGGGTIKAFAVTFAGDELVQRGTFSWGTSGGTLTTDLDTAVDDTISMAWNPLTATSAGAMAVNSSKDHEDSTYQRLKLVSSGATVQGDRGATDSASTGPWEVIWFLSAPNAVILSSLTAAQYEEGVLLEWKTGYEARNLGFNIYREKGGRLIQVNPELIKGSALMTGAEPRTAGFAYSWWDTENDQLLAVSGQQSSASRSVPPMAGLEATLEEKNVNRYASLEKTNNDSRITNNAAYRAGQRSVSSPRSKLSALRYFLEDVDLNGTKTLHGPVTPVVSDKPAPKKAQSMLLSQINRQQSAFSGQHSAVKSQEPALRTQYSSPPPSPSPLEGEGRGGGASSKALLESRQGRDAPQACPVEYSGFIPQGGRSSSAAVRAPNANIVVSSVDEGDGTFTPGESHRIPSDKPNATPAARQKAIAAAPSVKIFIQEEGWYRITQPQLAAAGLEPGVNPRLLQLFVDGEEQPINVRGGGDDRLGPQDSIEFYGTGLDTPFTDTRVYWLMEGSRPGKRIPKIGEDAGDRVSSTSFPFPREKKDRTLYFAALKNGDASNFFGAVVSATPGNQVLKLSHLDSSAPGNAGLEVSLQGVSSGAHQVKITVNGVVVGTMVFEGQALKAERFPLVQSGLVEGDNTVTLVGEGIPSDVSVVDYIRLTYWRTYTAEEDTLRITANGGDFLRVNGFSGSSVRVMDITDPYKVTEVEGLVRAEAGGYSAHLRVPGHGARTLLAFVDEEAKNPAAVAANQPSNLHQADQAVDLLMISYGLFLESLRPLKTWRESQGLSVAVVDVEDVYDEFSFGMKTPQALKNFLLYAKSSWQNPPRFVLLVGDASFDPRNFYGFGSFDFIPTKLVDTYYQETASDDWFVDLDEDGLPDMAIGRLPVRTPEEAASVISKITGYEQSAAPMTDVLMVADMADDSGDFPASSRQVEALFPEGLTVTEVFRNQFPDDVQVRNALLGSLNQGPLVVNYMGHGTTQFWRGGIFGSDDAKALTNGLRLPFFIHMACLNGWFHDPYSEGLAEALLKAEDGGAVAAWASSTLTVHPPQLLMDKELITLLFNGEGLTIGEAVKRAKAATTDPDVRRSWILFGDPATKLK